MMVLPSNQMMVLAHNQKLVLLSNQMLVSPSNQMLVLPNNSNLSVQEITDSMLAFHRVLLSNKNRSSHTSIGLIIIHKDEVFLCTSENTMKTSTQSSSTDSLGFSPSNAVLSSFFKAFIRPSAPPPFFSSS